MMKILILLVIITLCYSFKPISYRSFNSNTKITMAKGFGKSKDIIKSDNQNSNVENKKIEGTELANKTFIPFNENSDTYSNQAIISDQEISNINNNDDNVDVNLEKLAKKYGLGADKDQSPKKKTPVTTSTTGEKPFGEDVIAKIPLEAQGRIDNILITGVFLSLAWCVLCGVGMSAGALKIVFKDFSLAEELDGLILNLFTPSFTPSILIFFLFSITFGLFKFAQISSSQTVYRE